MKSSKLDSSFFFFFFFFFFLFFGSEDSFAAGHIEELCLFYPNVQCPIVDDVLLVEMISAFLFIHHYFISIRSKYNS